MSIAEISFRETARVSNRSVAATEVVVRPHEFARWQLMTKRAIDIVGATIGLIMFAPLFVLLALAVRLTSGKQVFFTQERVGVAGKHFRMRKFRTMVHDAESRLLDLREHNEAGGPLFKIKDDPRVTRLGSKLRPLGLDELPQLWNVLKGEMSLVGPRPALPHEVAQYDPRLLQRLRVKPGLTGLWQIKRGHELSFDDYANYDLFYVENWSVGLDAYVIAATPLALLRRRGSF